MAIRVPPGGSSLGSFLFTTSALALGGPRSQIFNGWAPDAPSGLDIDFTTGALDPRVTFARGSTATYYDSSGLLALATSGAPRFDYDPVTLAPRGLLLEEQRTNNFLQSQNIADAAWLVFDVTKIGIAPVADPAGGANAYEVAFGGTGGVVTGAAALYQNNAGLVSGQTYTTTVYVKAKTGTSSIRIGFYDGSKQSGSADIPIIAAGWTRISFTDTAIVTGVGGNFSLRGNAAGTTGNVYVYGFQAEVGASATSYIPTTTAAVTRSADTAEITGANFSGWYNASAGTFVAEYRPQSVSGIQPVISVNDTTANEAIGLYGSGTDPKAIIVDGGTTQADLDAGTITVNTFAKLGLAFTLNDFAASFDGGTVVTDVAGTLPTVTQLQFHTDIAGNVANLHIKRLQFFNTRKSNSELQVLTGADPAVGTGTLTAQSAVAASTTGVSGSTTSTAADTTWSTTDKSASVTLSNSNMTAASPGSGADCAVRSTQSQPAGKFYFEAVWAGSGGADTGIGIATSTAVLGSVGSVAANAAAVFQLTGGIWFNGANTGLAVGAVAAGAVLCFAIDLVNQKFWARKDTGNWNGTAGNDPATNTGGVNIAALFPTNPVFALACFSSTVPAATINFGATAFAQTAPSGFSSWKALSAGGLAAQAAALSSTTGVSGSLITDTTINAASAALSSATGLVRAIADPSALAAQAAAVSSTTGVSRSIATPVALAAQQSVISGLGGAGTTLVGTGVVTTRPALVAGAGLTASAGVGALQVSVATIDAHGVSAWIATAANLNVELADIDGLGEIPINTVMSGPYAQVGDLWEGAAVWGKVAGKWQRLRLWTKAADAWGVATWDKATQEVDVWSLPAYGELGARGAHIAGAGFIRDQIWGAGDLVAGPALVTDSSSLSGLRISVYETWEPTPLWVKANGKWRRATMWTNVSEEWKRVA